MLKLLATLGFALTCALSVRAASDESNAVADSLVGKVEVQRAGTQVWNKLSQGDKVRNNDCVRAGAQSFVRLTWSDGSASYVREKTQLLLALYDGGGTNIISRHITVFYGAVFFVLKEILPKSLVKSYDVKIYTPTSVVSLRGTALSVEVDTGTGASTVRVINGTVSVKNILKNSSMFLSAGFKTTVTMNTDPLVPRPMLSTDIAALKGWAPPDVVGRAMSEQLTEAGREHDVLTGNLKKKLLVMPFVNSSKYNGSWNITSGVARMLTGKLQHGPCAVEFADSSSSADPVIAAGKAHARFVVTGEIQDFDIAQHAEITASADEYREFYFARVRIAIQMIDVTDQRVVVDNVFSGDMRGANSKENSWQKISALTFSDQDPRFLKSILGAALTQAIEQSAEQLTKQLASE